MAITLLMIGETSDAFVKQGTEVYIDRLEHFIPFKKIVIPDVRDRKNLTPNVIKQKEATLLLNHIPKSALCFLLDEKGKEYTSMEFADFIQKQFNAGSKEIVFIIGGAYGVTDDIRKSCNQIISLSRMTYTHQFIRLMITEQLYRAMTILNNIPYHNN